MTFSTLYVWVGLHRTSFSFTEKRWKRSIGETLLMECKSFSTHLIFWVTFKKQQLNDIRSNNYHRHKNDLLGILTTLQNCIFTRQFFSNLLFPIICIFLHLLKTCFSCFSKQAWISTLETPTFTTVVPSLLPPPELSSLPIIVTCGILNLIIFWVFRPLIIIFEIYSLWSEFLAYSSLWLWTCDQGLTWIAVILFNFYWVLQATKESR